MLDICPNNTAHQPVADALALVKRYASATSIYYQSDETIPIAGVVRPMWRDLVVEKDKDGETRINRVNYELCVLDELQEKLRYRELWVVGANKYRNLDDDLPSDFEEKRTLALTHNNAVITISIILDYGARNDIMLAMQHIIQEGIHANDITEYM